MLIIKKITKSKKEELIKYLKKDILIYFSGKVIPAILNLLLIIIAFRYLGKEEYGRYSLIFYSVMLIHTVTFSWIQQGILRFLSSYSIMTNVVVKRFLILTLISSVASIGFVILTGFLYFKLPIKETSVLLLYILFYNIFMFQLTIYQATYKSFRYAVSEVFYNLIMFLSVVLLLILLKYQSYIIIFASMVAGLVVIEIPGTIIIVREFRKLKFNKVIPDKEFTKKIFNYGFLITIWLLVSYLFNIADRFIIKTYIGYDAVGIYSSVYDIIFKISTFLCIPVLLTYHPKIVNSWNDNKHDESRKLIREGLMIELMISIVFIIVFFIIKDILFNRILNMKGEATFMLTIPIIMGAFLWQMAMIIHKPLELKFKQTKMLTGIIISLTVNVILNLILVPRMGYVVAGYTTLLGVMIYIGFVYFSIMQADKKGKIKTTK